ncbi:MMPL family transporter [Nocardioides cavernae]|uniref:MMPL family transporter n=1 Tax=Nocardioides cavernae TaxID=1921566 RepID=A0ABR8N5B4_9ACTN|nr:MMPL family transporter [Nocardioides cavernae]MBD3923358.1 MMPL family transporter [Nocardioides cavernae]MBM7511719.1 putative membrane protein YdfJ with MMPL/SSD domain [Nocardioides cavernae]
MARLLRSLGSWCARHGFVVIAIWALIGIGVGAAVTTFGAQTNNDLSLPGTDSQAAKDLLQERFPPQQNGVNPIVFDVSTGKLTDDDAKKAVSESVKAIAAVPHVASVTDPVSSDGQTAGLLADDGQTAFAPVLLDIGSGDLTPELAQQVVDATAPATRAGITVAAGGSVGSTLSTDDSEISEVVGIVAAMIILTLVLGSLVAMGLPIVTAVVGLAVALGVVGLLGHAVAIPSSGPTLATMIGLGVGIDYALFLITRHQENLRDGLSTVESAAQAVATSGSAIVFAGCTVVIALLSLGVAGIPLVSALGLASAIAVVAAVLVAITLLPAFLGLLGHRIAWLSLPAFMRPRSSRRAGLWARWAGVVRRHPAVVAAVSLAALVPLVIPALSLELGQEDVGATSPETTERQAYDLVTDGFGVGYNGPLQVASALDPVAAPSATYTRKYDKAQSLKADLQQKQKDLTAQKKQLQRQQQQLEAQQQSLEDQQAGLESDQASLEARADQLQGEQAGLERQAAALQAEQRRLEAEQTGLEAQASALERRARAVAGRIRSLTRELARLGLRERVLQRRIQRAEGNPVRVARLRARLVEVRERQVEVRARLRPLTAEARRLAEQARRLRSEAARLKQQADALQRRADGLQRQKTSLEQQAAELQREGDQLQQQADSLRRQGDELQQQATELQQQADDLKPQQKQAQQEQAQAEKLKQQLTDMVTTAGGDERGTDPRVVRLQKGLSATAGVVALTPPQLNKKGDVVLLSAVPETSPASDDTADLVVHVRDTVLPDTNEEGGITSHVGGYTASYVDLASLISARLLLVIGTVILLGFLLLMVAFRSLLIPLQAAITNLLSAAAAFGVLTAAFQWGWGISLLGIDTADGSVPIASYVPLMMFAGLFGLSMDYEVFLVSHVQQHHHAGEEAREAVQAALASSARITTAAALIMASVFASFILNIDPTIKQFGVGLSVAVLLAGILVVTLAPAILVLFGRAAWWLPRWLDRILPHVSIEGEPAVTSAAEPAGTSDGRASDLP